jgi:hypothetical protein
MRSMWMAVFALLPGVAGAACDLSGYREVFGYYFEPGTGYVYDAKCVRQSYTFENAVLFDFRMDNMVRPMPPAPAVQLSPYAFATAQTAREIVKVVEELAPGSQPFIEERNYWGCPGGAQYTGADHLGICFSHPMRFVRVYPWLANPMDGGKGWPISAGQAANALMRNAQSGRRVIAEDLERGFGLLQRVNGR